MPKNSTENARDATPSTVPHEKRKATAAPNAGEKRHTVGSAFRVVLGDQEGGSLRHA